MRTSEFAPPADVGPRSWLAALALVSVVHGFAIAYVSTHRRTSVTPPATLMMEVALLTQPGVSTGDRPVPANQAAPSEAKEHPTADENPRFAVAPGPGMPPEPEVAPLPAPPPALPEARPQRPEPPTAELSPVRRAAPPKAAPTSDSTRRAKPPKVRADQARGADSPGGVSDGSGAAAAAVATEPRHDAAYLKNPPPLYPAAARRQNMQGRVLIYAVVSPAGTCARAEVRMTSGHAILDEAALRAVWAWRFVPASRDGQPVAAGVEIPIVFRLED